MSPGAGATTGSSATFSATVGDPSGVRSVTFVVTASDGGASSFAATASGSTYSAVLQGFTPGAWTWSVRATDTRGNPTTSTVAFTVGQPAPLPAGDSAVVANERWDGGGVVQTAVGRIFFEMPTTRTQRKWAGYVCSGTVVQDADTGRSVILTAAHCVYDDVNKAFARNVLFIPDQGASGTATDTNCDNDRLGCWAPSFGVVDTDWTTRTFPDNVPWDYAYYVVPGTGAHAGTAASSDSLESAVGSLPVDFTAPDVDRAGSAEDRTTALGYSYSDDPNFMYCAEDMTTEGADNWWLASCGLSGGASGGPWIQPMDAGAGPVVSVNSWGYSDRPGMAGPRLVGTSASTLFDAINGGQQPTEARGAALDR
jgi:hypothetical protein